jgi:hypothetical protein
MAVLLASGDVVCAGLHHTQAAIGPTTSFHYAANSNFAKSSYVPGALGFNVADVSDRPTLDATPSGVMGLVWLPGCSGATSSFTSAAGAFAGDPKLFGFYLADEPNASNCAPAKLKGAADWVHQNIAGAKTFIVLENLCASSSPCFSNSTDVALNPANTDVDLYGLDPYPVRTEVSSPNYSMINNYVSAAKVAGFPLADIVPVYQAFGGNNAWRDDGGGYFQLPTAAQEQQMMSVWAGLVPNPVFDYTYSWGVQSGDIALSDAPSDLQQVFLDHNSGSG